MKGNKEACKRLKKEMKSYKKELKKAEEHMEEAKSDYDDAKSNSKKAKKEKKAYKKAKKEYARLEEKYEDAKAEYKEECGNSDKKKGKKKKKKKKSDSMSKQEFESSKKSVKRMPVVKAEDKPQPVTEKVSDSEVKVIYHKSPTPVRASTRGRKPKVREPEYDGDDLRKIEGIGATLVRVLREAGVDSFRKLSKKSPEQLRKIMTDVNPRYRIYNPTTWPEQAKMAADGEWEDLQKWQTKYLASRGRPGRKKGATNKPADATPKVKRRPGRPPSKNKVVREVVGDDFLKIEGIGPKMDDVLKAAGIKTFKKLASKSSDKIRKILTKVNPRYRIYNPDTWADQAQMAANGKWDELKKWQSEMVRGKRGK